MNYQLKPPRKMNKSHVARYFFYAIKTLLWVIYDLQSPSATAFLSQKKEAKFLAKILLRQTVFCRHPIVQLSFHYLLGNKSRKS